MLCLTSIIVCLTCSHSTKPPVTLPSPPPAWLIAKNADGTYVVSGEFVLYAFRILGYANLYKIKFEICEKEKK